jgi:hypothetical protein
MRNTILALAALGLAACEAVPNARLLPAQSPEAERVKAALADWPRPAVGAALRRPFQATIHAAGLPHAVAGVLEYYGPRDFRITAVTETGAILFDGRVTWAGVTILRQASGIGAGVAEALLGDLTHAFELPADLRGLKAGDEKLVLRRRLGDERDYTWIFNRGDGRILEAAVARGFDTLHVFYRGYSAGGWPEELHVVRWARQYDVTFSFTEGSAGKYQAGK